MDIIIPLVMLVAVFYLLILRPARSRQKEVQQIQSALSAGSRVMLASGIYGTVVTLGDDTIELEIAPGTTVTAARQAVARIDHPAAEPDES